MWANEDWMRAHEASRNACKVGGTMDHHAEQPSCEAVWLVFRDVIKNLPPALHDYEQGGDLARKKDAVDVIEEGMAHLMRIYVRVRRTD